VSGSNPSPPPIVLLDTTVLCGAIRTDGVNRQLLKLAASNRDYRPVLSRVCLMEFYKNAAFDGIGGIVYSEKLIHQFLDLFVYPILENRPAVNSEVGRHHIEIVRRNGMEIGQALAEISGISTQEAIDLVEAQGLKRPLHLYDEQDVHVWVTAIREKCSYIVSSNTKRFPETIGNIKRLKPGEFYNMFMD
jgi:hypothetical protein